MSTTPYLAPSLVELRREIDARWPKRDRASDGWLGDAAHAARQSDHNPDARGMVHALDVDKDGIDVPAVLVALIGDARVWYVIHDRTIWSRTYDWKARPYTGTNAHTEHIHVSIRYETTAEQGTGPWLTDQEAPDMTPEEMLHAKINGAGDRYLSNVLAQTFNRTARIESALTALAAALGPKVEQAVKAALADAVVDVNVNVHDQTGG